MRRAPLVIGSTAVGLGLVLSFRSHTPSPQGLSASAGDSASAPTTAPPSNKTSNKTSPSSAGGTRTVTGQEVRYLYGDVEIQVKGTASSITTVTAVRNDATDPHSEEINSEAVPMLEQQTIKAQSAHIDGVSGATFTSEAYLQSLQSALDQLR